jgi:uncharacterized YigZ family protein
MQTLASRQVHETEIKQSRFVAVAEPVASPEEALARVEAIRASDATHNCWAYKIGDQYRSSDDGEPGGTAGRPILAAIEAREIDRVVVVVTRYYGGIKLGAGGLARAYGGAAAECLRLAPKKEIRRLVILRVTAPFDTIGAIYPLLERFGADKLDEEFGESGVTLTLELDEGAAREFAEALADATRGRGTLV